MDIFWCKLNGVSNCAVEKSSSVIHNVTLCCCITRAIAQSKAQEGVAGLTCQINCIPAWLCWGVFSQGFGQHTAHCETKNDAGVQFHFKNELGYGF